MSDCQSIDSLVTPFVDGELAGAERERIEQHLRVCAACRSRVDAERSVRTLMRGRQTVLKGECAPMALRAKCAGHCRYSGISAAGQARWRRFMPIAAAAIVVLGVGGFAFYQVSTRSTRVMAAELAADHVKCFMLDSPRTAESAATVEAAMAASFGWQVDLPDGPVGDEMELLGSRPCLFGGGRAAHIMYRHRGEPVSVFMLPKTSHDRGLIETLGHECAIWSNDERTFVLVAREGRDKVAELAARVESTTFH